MEEAGDEQQEQQAHGTMNKMDQLKKENGDEQRQQGGL